MKLAFCLFKYFPFGGLQRDFLRIANMCRAANHDVTVYTMEWQGEKPPHLKIEVLPKRYYSNHKNALNFAKMVQQRLKESPVDLLIGFDKIPGLDLYYCADSCFITKVNDQKTKYIKWFYSLTKRYKTFSYLEDAVFNAAQDTKVLFLSEQEQTKYRQAYNIQDNRCNLLPPNINKDRFKPIVDHNLKFKLKCDLSYKYNIDYNSHWLLMVGSGFRTKGLDRSIRLLKFLKGNNLKVNLIVIGQDKHQQFAKLAHKLQVQEHVKFLGAKENIQEFMAVSALLVHPAYRENTGTVILESIIMGLPVVASGICGYAKYVTEAECGKVIPEPFQQAEFNHAVLDLLRNETKLEAQSQSGLEFRETADIYNADGNILRTIENA